MQNKSPLIVGEVLFDQFEDGRQILGGAPFNVAWNLQGMGQHPVLISKVGRDSLGNDIKKRMSQWGMDLQGLQTAVDPPSDRDDEDPNQTGVVKVTLADGQPTYQIVYPRAYDQIDLPNDLLKQLDDFSLVYCGTLALRSPNSRKTIETINAQADRIGVPRFVDINVRHPWFEIGWLDKLLPKARYIKMNDQELCLISDVSCSTESEIVAAVQRMWQRFGEGEYWITCGSDGAWVISPDGSRHFAAAPEVTQLVDTVGAGDAFAAVVIDGMLSGRSAEETLIKGVEFAAKVCSIQGATVMDRSFYQSPASSPDDSEKL